MQRPTALILMIVGVTTSAATAGDTEEYVVTLACHGVMDEPCAGDPNDQFSSEVFDSASAAEGDPVLYRLQTTGNPGERFEVLMESGIETWELSGTLNETDSRRFRVELRHCHKTESGSVPTASGGRETIYDQTSVHTSVEIGLDEPIIVCGMLTHSTDVVTGEPVRSHCSRQHVVLRVTRKPSPPASEADSGD
jgi:hypothetical protein